MDAKFVGFSMYVGYHSMLLTHPIGMKWYKPSMMPLKDIGIICMKNARTMGLDKEKAKIHSALGHFTNDWT